MQIIDLLKTQNRKVYLETKLKGHILEVELKNGKGIKSCFQLFGIDNKKRNVIQKNGWNKCRFFLEEEGHYFVKEVSNNVRSEWIDYYSDETRTQFEKMCKDIHVCEDDLAFQTNILEKMVHPYKAFAVCIGRREKVSSEFLQKNSFLSKTWEPNIEIIAESFKEQSDKNIVFSGMMKKNGRFIWGENDVDDNCELNSDCLGGYTYLKIGKNEIEIGNDYFGVEKLYYYEEKEQFIVSNNYHLLLLCMKEFGIKGELNIETIEALLCKQNQAFQQSFVREREIKSTYMLPVDEKVIITPQKWKVSKKSIADVFEESCEEKKNEYLDELLEEGIREINENVEIILKDKRFENVIVDLTGGMDSRVVYGIVNKFPEFHDSILLNIIGSNEQFNNEMTNSYIGCELNSYTKYKYLDEVIDLEERKYAEALNGYISLGVLSGYYYPYKKEEIKRKRNFQPTKMELSGFFGEICCRPYWSRKLLEKRVDVRTVGELVPMIVSKNSILSGHSYNNLNKAMQQELEKLPGKNPLEKWESHYLFYRNGLHCDTIWEKQSSPYSSWGPLQSKALFKYKHLTYATTVSAEEQLKLLEKIDKRLILTSFDKQMDEELRIRYKEKYGVDWIYMQDEVENEIKKLSEIRNLNDKRAIIQKNEENRQNNCEISLDKKIENLIVKMIDSNPESTQEMGVSIFYNLKKKKMSEQEKDILYTKLLSVIFQENIFKNV